MPPVIGRQVNAISLVVGCDDDTANVEDGIFAQVLFIHAQHIRRRGGVKSDIFDVLAYVRFTLDPMSRSERVEGAKATGLDGYEAEMRDFLSYVLQAYELEGIQELAPHRISDFLQIRYGGTNDAKRVLGSIPEIRGAFIGIQKHLFS